MSKNLVIVESPAKAKTIEKYLGKDFQVLSSVGHIRKDTKVDVHDDFAVTYEVDPGHTKVVRELKAAAKQADAIWLATDEDREGESISWHLIEVLKLPQDTRRITFHEITEPALKAAIAAPRTIDMDMVSSQQARQTLDMLVGYDLSGVVRRKVPGAISAGRVQSPALRLVVEKEREIEKFAGKSNFKVTGEFIPASGTNTTPESATPANTTPESTTENTPKTAPEASQEPFQAVLEKKPLTTEEKAQALLESLSGAKYSVSAVDQTEGKKANPVPFTTAALQIEANSRLGFSASTTMRAAQALYQAGLITYHRTDSLNLSSQFLGAAGRYIEAKYGKNYHQPRHFKTKDASAQEAHEAIRPTHIENEVAGKNDFERKLYHLIRTRTLATQMAAAKVAKTTIKLTANDCTFVAKGEVVIFDGFLRVYGSAKDTTLPALRQGDSVIATKITARQTFSKPPARYTEGSLVKKLEELGIGRPSTYAGIMSAIQARGYVIKGDSEGKPRDVIELILDNTAGEGGKTSSAGRPEATAEDKRRSPVTTGATDAVQEGSFPTLTRHLVQEKSGATKGKLLPTPVGELVSNFLTDHFNQIVDYGFTAGVEEKLDLIAEHRLERVKMLRDFYTPFSKLVGDSAMINRYNSATELGKDPKTGKPIYAKIGKNGGFIQLGDNEKESGEKPRFAPLPKGKTVKNVTYEEALAQLALPALPRSLGKAKDGTEIIAASGPFGPYLKAGKYNVPLKGADPYTVTLQQAEPLYQAKIDSIIADWGEISIINGAYGPYIKGPGRRNNLKIPKDQDPKKITETQAREMLEAKNAPKSNTKSTTKSAKRTRRAPHRITRKKSATAKTTRKTTAKATKSASATTTRRTTTSKTTKKHNRNFFPFL